MTIAPKLARELKNQYGPSAQELNDAVSLNQADGGTVTQITSIATTVVLSTRTGQITTVSSTLGTGADATFTCTNTTVSATSVIVVHTASYGGTADGIPIASVASVGSGTFDINIRNTGATTLDAVIVINFMVFGGSAN